MTHHDSTSEMPAHDLGTRRGENRPEPLIVRRTRSAHDASGINPEDRAPIDPRMPHLPPA
jgi:hypothetical protein